MHLRSLNNKGFGLTEVLIAVVVLVVIGAVGGYLYDRDHQTKAMTISTYDKSPSASKSPKTTMASNPYAGWKSYCDNTIGYCFKYPTSWQLSNQSTTSQVSVTIEDRSTDTLAAYNNPDNDDAFPATSFYTDSISPLTGDKTLTLIGGYWSDQNGSTNDDEPFYAVIDTSYLNANPLALGAVGELSSDRFTDAGTANQTGSFILEGGQGTNANGELPLDQVKSWLNSQTTQTGVLILKSLTSQ
jgi:prepilin-type N-terminal cleavage/methylation domain-containing protein